VILAHVNTCAACARELEDLQRTADLLVEQDGQNLSELEQLRIANKFYRQQSERQSKLSVNVVKSALRIAAVLALVGIGFGLGINVDRHWGRDQIPASETRVVKNTAPMRTPSEGLAGARMSSAGLRMIARGRTAEVVD
jgi:hypothetical protein